MKPAPPVTRIFIEKRRSLRLYRAGGRTAIARAMGVGVYCVGLCSGLCCPGVKVGEGVVLGLA